MQSTKHDEVVLLVLTFVAISFVHRFSNGRLKLATEAAAPCVRFLLNALGSRRSVLLLSDFVGRLDLDARCEQSKSLAR